MTIKNNNIGDKNRKISGKKIMLVTALLSGGVVIRVKNHLDYSFANQSKEVINYDLTLESTDVLIDDNGVFYVGQGTPIKNFDIYDFVTILDESGNVIPKSEVTLEWDIKEYFEGTEFDTKGEYLITISATTNDGRTGELEYKLIVKEGHIFEEIEAIEDVEVEQTNVASDIDFQEHFRVLNSVTGEETITDINSTLEDENLRSVGTKQIIFYTELNGTRFTNSVHISVVDTVAPVIELEESFNNDFEWDQKGATINISDLDKTLGDFSLDQFATAYDGSGEYELSWDFEYIMTGNMDKIGTKTVTISAVDGSGNERKVEIYVNISTVKFEFKAGISEIAFELYHNAVLEDDKYKVNSFYNIYDAGGNLIADDKISWNLTEEMVRELGTYRIIIEVLDSNNKLIGSKGVEVKVQDTLAPIATLVPSVSTTFNIEVNQNMSVDNLFMYLNGISGIDELISVVENSGVWGYRFIYNNEELTDSLLRGVGNYAVRLELFDYDKDGEVLNNSMMKDSNGNDMLFMFNVVDTTKAIVNVTNDTIDLEVVQNATKEMIEINNYAEIADNSGTFTWDLRVKGSQEDVMDYGDMLGKITSGTNLELVVIDAGGNVTYADMLLIITDTQAPILELRKDEEIININPSAGDLTNIRNIENYVRISDNSGDYIVLWDFDKVVGQAKVAGEYYVTITAEDASGNVSEVMIKFVVVDEEAPTIIVNTKSIEIEANEYMNIAEFEFDENLNDYITVSDNSGVKPNVTFDYSNVDFGELGVYEVIITATDNANNSAMNIIEIKVIAGNPKVNLVEGEIIDTIGIDSQNQISGIKAVVKGGKIVVEKANSDSDEDELFTYLTIEDLLEFLTISGEEIVSSTWDMDLINLQLVGTKDVTLNVTNNFGKTTTMVIEVVVINEWDSELKLKDGVENFIDLQIDITDTNRDVAWFKSTYDVKDYVDYRTTGNPDDLEWSINSIDFNTVGSTVITITMNDGTNIHEVSLNLNIIDTTKPVFTIIKDTEAVEINADDASGFSITDFVTVSDNGDVSPTLSWNLSSQVDFGKSGTYTVTIKAVDMYGNESTQEITFDIGDNTKPVITINAGMDTQTIEINSRNESHFNVNSFVTAMDNSGVAPELEWDIESVDFATVGTNTVTIKAKDDAGNEAIEVTVEFIIVDTIAPSIDIDASGLDELKIEIDTKSESDYSDWLEDYVTVTDNSGETITPTWNISGVNFDAVGTYEIVITAIDSETNSSTVKVVFVVADTTAPTITLKDNMETTEYEVFNQLGSSLSIDDFATCDDATNCIMSWDMDSVNFDRVGTYVVTIKAVDMYGNESIQEITIEVIDTVSPVIEITRADILVSMGKFKSSDFDVNDFAKVTDNYDNSVVLTWNIEDVNFDVENDYDVTISAIDSSGNAAVEKIVKFKVEEINIVLETLSDFEIEVTQTPDVSAIQIGTYFNAKEEDGSAVEGITWDLTNDMLKTYGTHSVILTITFDGGKTITMEVTLEVVDTTLPEITSIKTEETVELGDTDLFDSLTPEDFVSVKDNSNQVTLSWDFDNVVEQTVVGSYSVTITATDLVGNVEIETINIIVVDTTDPTLVLNEDFNKNNMTWSKSTSSLTILAEDKAVGEIDLWELVTATDLSTAGLTISWGLTEANLNTVGHYTIDIDVSDGYNVVTETITVNVLRATPILNDFNVDKSYDEITVNVDVTNLNEAITSLVITVEELNGNVVGTYTHTDFTLDSLSINELFAVHSNTEYNVKLVYQYSLQENQTTQIETVTDSKNVKTLAYSQNDVLGTITDTYISHTEIIVNYEINNDLGRMTEALLVLIDEDGNDIISMNYIIDVTEEAGTHSFVGLTPNTKYKVEIRITYDFNDGSSTTPTKVGDSRELETLAYTEHDVITDITGITQSQSTISADYSITDVYGLINVGTMKARIYNADTMTEITSMVKDLTNLNGTVLFTGLDANTSYVVVIEASLNLQDGSTVKKETGAYTTTEAYQFEDIVVNISNVAVDYNDITFEYEVFDPNGLLVGTTDADKLKVVIGGQSFNLTGGLRGTVKLSDHLNEVNSGTTYDVEIHFDYNLKENNSDISHENDLYGFVESTRAYDVNTDLTLTSHNLASDTRNIYVDYTLRNLNLIGDMDTLAVTITDGTNTTTTLLKDFFSSGVAPLEGQIVLDKINGNDLVEETDYQITISIDYDLKDGYTGVQREVLLLEDAQIQTKEIPLAGYDVASTITRGYTFLNVDFVVDNSTTFTDFLDTFQIALLDENDQIVPGYDYKLVSGVTDGSSHTVKFENLLSDATYKIVYRVENPNYPTISGQDEFIEITRSVTTRTYDTNLINVDYTLEQGLTYLYLKDINILNTNEVFEKIDYSSVIVVITYTTRDGQVITVERDLGSLTEGDMTSAIFTGIQSNTDVNIEFKLEYDLKDGAGIQSGSNEIVRTSDTKTLEYDFTFVIENDEVIVTGLTPGFTGDHLVIFEEVEGYAVREIKNDAFYSDSISFTELTIPKTLDLIGDNAFRNVTLTTVNLENISEVQPVLPIVNQNTQALLVIGDNAFRGNSIAVFDFSTLVSVGDNAFDSNEISILNFSERLETIGKNSFKSNNITSLELPNSVVYIDDEAFRDNYITQLETGEFLSDENFGSNSFSGNAINNLTIGNVGFKYNSLGRSEEVFDDSNGFRLEYSEYAIGSIAEKAWQYIDGNTAFSQIKITDLVLGSGIEHIGDSAFSSNLIKTVDFNNNNVETIGSYAFYGNLIEEIELPDSVEYIGDYGFRNNMITKLSIGSLLSDENFGTDTFKDNKISDLTLGNVGFRYNSLGRSEEVFDDTNGFRLEFSNYAIGTIADKAWQYVDGNTAFSQIKITELALGSGIEHIGDSAFSSNLIKTVDFDNNNVETIGSYAFFGNLIEEIKLPDSVEYIGDYGFRNNMITKLSIGSLLSDQNFGNDTFKDNKISDLTLGNVGFKYNSLGRSEEVFDDTNGFRLEFSNYAIGTIADKAWQYVDGNTAFSQIKITDLVLGTGIEHIGASAFSSNLIKTVDFDNNNVETIGSYAFTDNLIENLTLPNQLEEIGNHAFNKNIISTLTLGEDITKIGDSVFEDNLLTSFTIGDKLEYLGAKVFKNNAISELTIPGHVTFVGESAFENNTELTKLEIENGVETSAFGSDTFKGTNINNLILSNTNFKHNTLGDSDEVFDDSNGFRLEYTNQATGTIVDYAWQYLSGNSSLSQIKITDLVLGTGIEHIGASAFSANELTSIDFGVTNIKTIGEYAFYDNNLSSATLGDKLTGIGSFAFENNNISSVTIGVNIENIGAEAFKGNSLTEVTIPSNVISIGDEAFANNTTLKKLIIESGVENSVFGNDTFKGTNINNLILSNTNFKHNTLGDSDEVFDDTNGFRLEYTNQATGTIVDYAWQYLSGNSSLSQIKITDLVIGSGIEHIGASAFSANELTSIDFGVTNIKTIGEYAFYDNNLSSVTLGDKLTEIGSFGFENNSISTVTIGVNISNIGVEAFKGNSLTEVTIPSSVTSIGDEAFANNTALKKLIIESGVENSVFGNDTFKGTNINNLILSNTNFKHNTLGDSDEVFDDSNGFRLEYTNQATGTIIDSAWQYLSSNSSLSKIKITDLVIGTGIEHIGASAFSGNELTSIDFGVTNIKTIGEYAFYDNNLSNVTLGDKLTEIGSFGFENNSISTVTIGANIANIGVEAFKGNSLTEVTIPSSVSSIGDEAFANNTALKKLIIESGVENSVFGNDTFKGTNINNLILSNTNFKHNTLGDSDEVFDDSNGFRLEYTNQATGTIVDYAWQYLSSNSSLSKIKITDLVIGIGIEHIGASAFSGNELTNIDFGVTNIKTIGAYAFYGNNLSSANLGDKLTEIGNFAFEDNRIAEVTIPGTVTTVGDEAFANNAVLSKLTVEPGVGVNSFGSNTFTGNVISHLVLGNGEIKHNTFGLSSSVFNDSSGFKLEYSDGSNGNIPSNAWRYVSGSSTYSRIEITELNIGSGIESIGDNAFQDNEITKLTIGKINEFSGFFGKDTFIGNRINNLILSNGEIEHDTLGRSQFVFNASNGFRLEYTDDTNDRIIDKAWQYISGNTAFSQIKVTQLIIGDNVPEIGPSAFSSNSISTVVIPDSVTTIGSWAFSGNSMTSIDFGNSLQFIGAKGFDANNFTLIRIPASIQTIEESAFRNNNSLNNVYFMGNVVVGGTVAFPTGPTFRNASGGIIS